MRRFFCVLGAAWLASPAHAGWTILSNTSRVSVSAVGGETVEQGQSNFTTFSKTINTFGVFADALVHQRSYANVFQAGFSTRVQANSYPKGGIAGGWGTARSESSFSVLFSVQGSLEYSLSVLRETSPLSSFVELKNVTTGDMVHRLTASDPWDFATRGKLGSGVYQIEMRVVEEASQGELFDGWFQGQFTVLPSPGALSLAVAVGLVNTRRRRLVSHADGAAVGRGRVIEVSRRPVYGM